MSILSDAFKMTKEEQLSAIAGLASISAKVTIPVLQSEDFDVEEEFDFKKEFEQLRNELLTQVNAMSAPKGDKGDKGKDGKDGKNGKDGRDGLNGKNGIDGKDGVDGISIEKLEITFDNHLVVTLSNGSELDAGAINVENITNYVTQIKGETVPSYSSRYDQVSDALAYKGEAIVGASEDAPLWSIQKLEYGIDGDVSITWSNGVADFNNIWTNRAILTYR